MKIKHNVPRIKDSIINYVKHNKKEYILVSILFIIGLFIGVIIINNCNQNQTNEIITYISDLITKLKDSQNIDKSEIFISSIKNNIFLTIIIWISGTTVIGIPIVLTVIIYRGLCLGYTISAISISLGRIKGILFCIASLCIQNIIFIPALLSLGVSSIKLYKSIIKDRRRENIKIEIIRHTMFSCIMLGILILSSFLENVVSFSILQEIIKKI